MKFGIEQNKLRDIFERLKLNTGTGDRYSSNGIHFIVCSTGILVAESLDGYRASVIEEKIEKPYPDKTFDFIIEPFKIARVKSFVAKFSQVLVSVEEEKVVFEFVSLAETKKVPRIPAGDFMKLNHVMPSNAPDFQISMNPKYLIDALKITQNEKDPVVLNIFKGNNYSYGTLIITNRNSTKDTLSLILPVKPNKSDKTDVDSIVKRLSDAETEVEK